MASKTLKLGQVIAIEKGVKAQTNADFTTLHRLTEKTALLNGITKTYQTLREDDPDIKPDERTPVQVNIAATLTTMGDILTRLFNVTAAKDWANQKATANVVVGSTVLLESVPVTYLLFLEKQLNDLHKMVKELPVLDATEEWHWDENANAYASPPVRRVQTKKVLKNHELSPATKEHPAQIKVFEAEEVIGYTTTIKFSGAITGTRKKQLMDRVVTLQQAVKIAREEANAIEAEDQKIGEKVFAYLLGA